MFRGRVNVVQSSTGTGKTTSAVAYASRVGMPILSVCQLRSQVQTHVDDFKKKGLDTIKYDDVDALKTFDVGTRSLVTTIDSLPKVQRILREKADRYIVLFDEFHSLMTYMNFSSTLQQTRREAVKAMRWLTIHAGSLITMDNEITDLELQFLDDALAGGGETEPFRDLTFVKNDFKTFANVPVRYVDEQAEMFDHMRKDIEDGRGFTAPCNTKKQAERIHIQLLEALHPASAERFKLYTSEQGTAPADVDAEWSRNWVIYSPTITTGIDFQPKEPQNVYLFLKGEETISPAAALQMITRNRRIKVVYIHATQMRNKPVYASVEQMDRVLDDACRDTPKPAGPAPAPVEKRSVVQARLHFSKASATMQCLRTLQNGPHFNAASGEDEYSDSDFSRLYKQAIWHDNVMRSAFLHNLDGLLRSRGFDVQARSIFPENMSTTDQHFVVLSDADANRRSVQKKQEAAERYLNDETSDTQDGERERAQCERILAASLGIKETERLAKWGEIEHMRIMMRNQMHENPEHRELYLRLFTDSHAVQHYLNLKLAISTDEKLRENAKRNAEKDFCICTLSNSNARVQLLRQLISEFNHGMLPATWLKAYDLTLKQDSYDENERVTISDEVCRSLQRALAEMRRPRDQPKTRRSLMDCIFVLSEHLFGKHFTSKRKTRKRTSVGDETHNVYNYETDQAKLGLMIKLMTTSHRIKCADIEPDLVHRFNLIEWQRLHA